MTEDAQRAEIDHLLQCESSKKSPFDVLHLDIATCDTSAVKTSYRRVALLLHPDKCTLAGASDAFTVAERAYKTLSQEPILERLKRAHERQQSAAKAEEAAAKARAEKMRLPTPGNGVGAAPTSSTSADLPPIPFGTLSHLSSTGLSTDAQKSAEIKRILQCKPNDYFIILDINPDTCESVDEVHRRYRRVAQALHPDKCKLPRVAEAFTRMETAHKDLGDEKKFIRFKIGFQQQRKKEAMLRAAEAAKHLRGGDAFYAGDMEGLSREERVELRKRDLEREQQLEAIRLGEEAERKRRRLEREEAERAERAAQLESDRNTWREMQGL